MTTFSLLQQVIQTESGEYIMTSDPVLSTIGFVSLLFQIILPLLLLIGIVYLVLKFFKVLKSIDRNLEQINETLKNK